MDSLQISVGGDAHVYGDLTVPDGAVGIVVFAHGSGSGRHSPRNRMVASRLNERGLATLLLDLLTSREEILDQRTGELRFEIALLASRLQLAANRLASDAETAALPLGYFGASTGAAAALVAASAAEPLVHAVVSRGGRPDLAGEQLAQVSAPTLLIVGSRDPAALHANDQALDVMRCERDLVVVEGATHLFEEPGALDQVAVLAGDWFTRYLASASGNRGDWI